MSSFIKKVKSTVNYWYLPLIVGILLIVAGIYVISTPLDSYLGLSIIFSISFIIAGIAEIIFAFSNKKELDGWGWYLVGGLLTLLMGVFLITYPNVSIVILPFVVGFTIMFRSFQALGYAYELKNYGIMDWGNMAIIGTLGVLFSFILIFNPMFAGLSVVIWTGIALIVVGGSGIYLAIKLKKVKNMPGKISEDLNNRWDSLQGEIKDAVNEKQ